ncbi:hypothetical protein MMC13_000836 [Lambiella insularis]|nr:hypothetical protein [Lambiella insularis]
MPARDSPALEFDSIEDTIRSFKNSSRKPFLVPKKSHLLTSVLATEEGKFIIVLDSQDRENEGDLIIAAEAVTTEKMSFMIRYTSGLICTPMPASFTERLDLPQMVVDNTESHRTAFTFSVDASHPSVTTGISAHDRALTCRALASPKSSPSSFWRPGHIFPLRARDGGVKVRTGHTEAAVDFCRLAGMQPVGVICEMVDDGAEVEGLAERTEGGMLRRDGCLQFGRKWGLKVCTIEDLAEYIDHQERGKNGVHGKS